MGAPAALKEPAPVSDPAEDARLRRLARAKAVRRDFVTFLRLVRVLDPDDGPIAWQPWPTLLTLAQAWARGESTVILKARQLGVSWLVAAYCLWLAMYRPYSKNLVISKSQMDGDEMITRIGFIYDNLPWWARAPVKSRNTSEFSFHGGGEIQVLAPTDQRISVSYQL